MLYEACVQRSASPRLLQDHSCVNTQMCQNERHSESHSESPAYRRLLSKQTNSRFNLITAPWCNQIAAPWCNQTRRVRRGGGLPAHYLSKQKSSRNLHAARRSEVLQERCT